MSAQDMLWAIPSHYSPLWHVIVACMAIPTAVIMFFTMIYGHPFNALFVARLMILGAMVGLGLAPLNSGWLPWATLQMAAGGLFTSVLLATRWCDRPDQTTWLVPTLWCWTLRQFSNGVHWLAGPYKVWHHPE